MWKSNLKKKLTLPFYSFRNIANNLTRDFIETQLAFLIIFQLFFSIESDAEVPVNLWRQLCCVLTYSCIWHTAVSYHNAIHDMNFLWKEKCLSPGVTVLLTVKKFKMFPRWKQMFTYNWGWLNFDGLKCVFLLFSEKKKPTPDCGYIWFCVCMCTLWLLCSHWQIIG